MIKINHNNCTILIRNTDDGLNKVNVENNSTDQFIPIKSCKTNYPVSLIKLILKIKGPAYLCDEIQRDEGEIVESHLFNGLLSTINYNDMENKKILDFGCGAGASTMILNRLFPDADEIIGVELEERLVSVCKARKNFYNTKNIKFIKSPSPTELPNNLEKFDLIVLSAVFEHMLPNERKSLFPKIFSYLNVGGLLYLDQTPYRYWPFESHTTGLPFINYFPDKIAYYMARKFSKHNLQNNSWADLLRNGIRGGAPSEIINLLSTKYKVEIIKPCNIGLNDHVDLWYKISSNLRFSLIKKIVYYILKLIKICTGIPIVPSLTLSIRRLS